MYATLELAKIRQQQALALAETPPRSNPASGRLRAALGTLLIRLGQRLQARHQYGTVLHAG